MIVPYLVRHPGTELKEAAALFDVSADQLRADLNLLFMSGLPPYGPGDLIDVEVDDENRIWIGMADHFSRPLRLTRREALAVYLRGTELAATPGVPEAPALEAALARLRATLDPELLGEAEDAIGAAKADGSAPPHLDLLLDAARTHRRLAITYHAASTGRRTERRIDPEQVFASSGRWYVAAWDDDAEGERLFRADRILEAAPTGDAFGPRGLEGAGRPLYTPAPGDVEVRLRLGRGARWIAEYYAVTEVRELEDGSVEVALPTGQLGWVAKLMLRAGPEAEVLAPDELAEQVRTLARETLTQYRR